MTATTLAGGVAAGATAVPFIGSMMPSERAKVAGAPVQVDIGKLGPGQKMTVEWQGKPAWIVHRTKAMLEAIRDDDARVADPLSRHSKQPEYARNVFRSLKPGYLVLVGICTHLGCSPTDRFERKPDWRGGFYCPCHGSLFDLAGRVHKNSPAPTNLVVPPYQFLAEDILRIGDETKKG